MNRLIRELAFYGFMRRSLGLGIHHPSLPLLQPFVLSCITLLFCEHFPFLLSQFLLKQAFHLFITL